MDFQLRFTDEKWDYRFIYINRADAQPLIEKIKRSVSFVAKYYFFYRSCMNRILYFINIDLNNIPINLEEIGYRLSQPYYLLSFISKITCDIAIYFMFG